MGDARPPEWTPITMEWGGRRGTARPPEWRETQGGGATEWAGESSRLRAPTPPLPRVLPPQIPDGLHCVPLAPASPPGGPASPPRRRSQRRLSVRHSRWPAHPPVALPPLFLVCPVATLSACRRSPTAPPAGIVSSSVSVYDASLLPPLHPSILAPSPVPPLPSSCGPVQPLAPPLALLPLAPAADIARKDEDVCDRTGIQAITRDRKSVIA